MTDTTDEPVTTADVLSGRGRINAPLKITREQRLYYNYRFDRPSLELEGHGPGGSTTPRDFRSERERLQDA